ncbi:MAG: FG-GAP-like repeat-containing protein [Sandaracinaceae bacterium]|nr:FG-GAP-like repeat-containing protein [Sandaracinaceae bacterium]
MEPLRPALTSRVVTLALAIAGLAAAGCDCGAPPPTGCDTSSDCTGGLRCVDHTCVPREDGGAADTASPPIDAPRDDVGSDAGRPCESMTVCGSPPVCCAVGEECALGACLPACASGVRCGAELTTCCGAEQACVSGACTDLGDRCVDSFDCPIGAFCEPLLGRCLPQFEPVTCAIDPVFGPFDARVEWSAETATDTPECMHGISAPVVVDLTGDGRSEIVANFACDDDWQHGVLRAYGGDGTPLWSLTSAGERLNGRTGIAAADLDGDGRAEIVAVLRPTLGSRPIAVDHDGTVLWRATQEDGTTPLMVAFDNGAPTIADLDADGAPEVILGAVVLDGRTGVREWQRDTGGGEGTNSGYGGGIAAVADLDGDHVPEIVTGHRAYHRDGTAYWTSTAPDGYPAIAQLDADVQPEVVLVASGSIYVLDGLSGTIEWGPIAQPGGGRGGPPTVADFDGDGRPEIGVAGAASYSVYDRDDPDGVLWSRTTQDVSSNATGSSVFDFEGDGAAEVVYGDECYMRVYRGSDGEVLLQIPSTSATIHEYPLVADVDADGNSEIVIVANDRVPSLHTQCLSGDASWDGARRGLFVYGDVRDQWMRTRRVWGQHTYHVTDLLSNGAVPSVEVDNWSTPGLNNYRQNVQGEGVYNAPDLTVIALEVLLDGCPASVRLRARVSNEGNLGAPSGIPVAFYTGSASMRGTLLGVGHTTIPLLPGQSEVVELASVALAGEPPYAFVAFADDDGAGGGVVIECDEGDNAGGIGDLDCDILF